MSVSVQDWSGAELSMSNGQSLAYPRPQVGIERLPARRMSNEPRESMNCKSCRKRKIKCNRLRPSCEACQIFQCSCIYDAVPKKRGPKTDVLESLLKRVDGLEAQLREKNDQTSPTAVGSTAQVTKEEDDPVEPAQKRIAVETSIPPATGEPTTVSPLAPATAISKDSPISSTPPEALLSTYFSRFHAKPFQILDESSIRQRMQLNQLPDFLSYSICAVASRYTPHPGGYQSAVKLSEDYAAKARREINTDEPTIDGLQATLLLVISFTAAGKGKKAYMLMTTAVGMAMALEIHTEMDPVNAAPMERETRRRLFWACYLLDRFMACGSKRPSLISDKTIMLRLPSWSPGPSAGFLEGEFFQPGSNLQYYQGTGKKSQGSTGMLIDITRILGITNRYLAAGGVRGDSHFPWHSLSNLSKIRQHLDTWASGTVDMFSSLESLFGQADSTVLVLSKLIYHLIHCLIYRPFLPINLAELAGSGQHESWQIEATNMCFLHANAIAELIELGKHSSNIEWPAFVGYCICTAGTVHIHGSHYSKQNGGGGEMNVFASSAHFLAREMQHLSELRYAWASVQHQRETLQGIYNAHAELVKTVTGGSMRFAPSFHLEDFFDRYMNIGGPGGSSFHFDAANLSLSDAVVDFTADAYSGPDVYAPRGTEEVERPGMKRKSSTFLSLHTRVDSAVNGFPQTSYLRGPGGGGGGGGGPNRGGMNQQSPALITTQNLAPHPNHQRTGSQHRDSISATNEASMSALANFAAPNEAGASNGRLSGSGGGGGAFSPLYNLASTPAADHKAVGEGAGGTSFDPMFGTLPTNAFSSPAAWHAHDGQADEGQTAAAGAAGAAATGTAATDGKTAAAAEVTTSPGDDHSPGANGQGDEKDPFLSLLEQLAENEKRLDRGGASDLDFFLAGAGTGG